MRNTDLWKVFVDELVSFIFVKVSVWRQANSSNSEDIGLYSVFYSFDFCGIDIIHFQEKYL